MDVGSTINIYGNLFGWHVYDMMYDFFISTGLWLIPFFIMFYQVFKNRGYGDSDVYDPKNAMIAMEMKVYGALIVIFLFFVPYVSVSSLDFKYYDGTNTQTAGNTNTTFDGLEDNIPSDVKIPVGWYGVLYLSTGLRNVLKEVLPTDIKARDLMYQNQQVDLDDPALKAELQDFEQRCRQPAQARLNAIRNTYPDTVIGQQLDAYQKTKKDDIANQGKIKSFIKGSTDHWMILERYPGNKYFMDTLYDDSKLCKVGDDPYTTACIPKTNNPLTPPNGTDCATWWEGTLGNGINDKLGDAFDKAPDIISVNEDAYVASKLMALGGTQKGGEKGLNDKKGDWFQWGSEKALGVMLNVSNFINSATNAVIRFALPIIQGLALMVIFMLLVLFIVVGQYSLPQMASLAILLFGISFLNGIWHIIAWIDNVMLLAMNGGIYGVVELIDSAFSLERAVWNLVVFASYIFLTIFWLRFMMSLGAAGGTAVESTMHSAAGMHGSAMMGGRMYGAGKKGINAGKASVSKAKSKVSL